MRLPRLLAAVPALLLALPAPAPAEDAKGDDTKAFLDPSNWEGRKDLWTIDNGTIVGETKEDPKYNTFLCSKKKYGDFELSFKVQLRDGVGNSGVQVRSEVFDKEKFRVRGPQVDAATNYYGCLYGEGVGGYLLRPKEPAGKPKDFNEYHVTVKGNHITIRLNGETTVDADFPDDKGKHPTPAEGIIAFQIHAGFPKMRVEFKDIRFTDLSKKK